MNNLRVVVSGFAVLFCCTSCVWMFSFTNPERELHAIFFTDGSCLYSFEGLDYGKREDQRWSENSDLFQYYLKKFDIEKAEAFQDQYYCTNTRYHPDKKEFEENWPAVYVAVEQLKLNGLLTRNSAGNFAFRIESYKDIYSDRNSSLAEQNDENFYARVQLVSGSKLNEDKIKLKYGEKYSVGTKFKSIDSPTNMGVIYSPNVQYSTGKFMEIRTKVRAVRAL